jgi:hypothetical protein
MPEKTEYLPADGLLKTARKGDGDDHDGHTDRRGGGGDADDETGNMVLPAEGDPTGYEGRYIQGVDFM